VLAPRKLLWVADAILPIAASFAQLASADGARFEFSFEQDLPAVRASEMEVREALSNLLDNALKYGTGLIALTVSAVDQHGDSQHGGGDTRHGATQHGHMTEEEEEEEQQSTHQERHGSRRDASALRVGGSSDESESDGGRSHGGGAGGGGGGGGGGSGLPIAGVRISVWNSGVGLPDAELSRVFEPGFRGHNAQVPMTRGGSGLGLSIVRELVTGIGGVVSLRNAPAPEWLAAREMRRADETLSRGVACDILLPRAPVKAPRRLSRRGPTDADADEDSIGL
jgi:signal transduction histidine kinase